MSPRVGCRRETKLAFALVLTAAVAGCTSMGDFGRLDRAFVADDVHDWVGREAAAHAGAPVSSANRLKMNVCSATWRFRYRPALWPGALGRDTLEYGIKRQFRTALWVVDPTAYYQALLSADFRSTAGRYNRLIDDIRNDVVRIGPFFDIARRVVEMDRKRRDSLDYLPDIAQSDRFNAFARIAENTLTIEWVQHSLAQRSAGYRFALDHWWSPSRKTLQLRRTWRSFCCNSNSRPTR